jgi:predicted helicase
VKAGERLADLHLNYEKQQEYSLERIAKKEKLDWRVEKCAAAGGSEVILTIPALPPAAPAAP